MDYLCIKIFSTNILKSFSHDLSFGDIWYCYYEYYTAIGNQKHALQCLETALQKARLFKDAGNMMDYTNELHTFLINGINPRASPGRKFQGKLRGI